MSLVKTLAKVAIGVAVAKGAQAALKGGGTGGIAGMLKGNGGGGALGEMMSSLTKSMQGGPAGAQSGMAGMQKGMSDMMGQMAAGGQATMGGLGDMMAKMTSGQSVGGLQNVLSQMGSGGGLGALLGGAGAAGGAGGLGALLGGALLADPTPPEPSEEAIALVMLRAMLQAAKCDGRLDEAEQAQIEQMVGGMSAEESALIKKELAAPVDAKGLAAEVPKGLEEQAYMMSLIAIDLDNQAEAAYLIDFAGALGLSREQVASLHKQAGEPAIT
jgi:uncharacterized membrane protein YebE (DUF533 family)